MCVCVCAHHPTPSPSHSFSFLIVVCPSTLSPSQQFAFVLSPVHIAHLPTRKRKSTHGLLRLRLRTQQPLPKHRLPLLLPPPRRMLRCNPSNLWQHNRRRRNNSTTNPPLWKHLLPHWAGLTMHNQLLHLLPQPVQTPLATPPVVETDMMPTCPWTWPAAASANIIISPCLWAMMATTTTLLRRTTTALLLLLRCPIINHQTPMRMMQHLRHLLRKHRGGPRANRAIGPHRWTLTFWTCMPSLPCCSPWAWATCC